MTTTVSYPDIYCEAFDDNNGDLEESSDKEDNDDPVDYTATTIPILLLTRKQVLDTIN